MPLLSLSSLRRSGESRKVSVSPSIQAGGRLVRVVANHRSGQFASTPLYTPSILEQEGAGRPFCNPNLGADRYDLDLFNVRSKKLCGSIDLIEAEATPLHSCSEIIGCYSIAGENHQPLLIRASRLKPDEYGFGVLIVDRYEEVWFIRRLRTLRWDKQSSCRLIHRAKHLL